MRHSDAESWFDLQHAVDILIAAVLLGAAAGKSLFLSAESRLGLFSYPGVLAGVVLLEVAATAWFLCLARAYPRITRFGGLALFGSFAAYSMGAWMRGEPCQCFGQASVSPLVALTIDVVVVGLLWLRSPLLSNMSHPISTVCHPNGTGMPLAENAVGGG